MELHWIAEAAQKPQGVDETLYASVIAPPKPYLVAIFDGAEHDADATARDGRPRYRNTTMIAIRIMGETDFTSVPLTDEHKARFPRAWGIYQKERDKWASTIPLTLMPGCTEADRLELEALGITDVDALAKAESVPENLEPLRIMARRIRKPHVRLPIA